MSNTMYLAGQSDDIQSMASIRRISVNRVEEDTVQILSNGEDYNGEKYDEGIVIQDGDFDGSETQQLLEEGGAVITDLEREDEVEVEADTGYLVSFQNNY